MTSFERYTRWMTRRYGINGRAKPVWAWLAEAALLPAWPRWSNRRAFLGAPPVGCSDGGSALVFFTEDDGLLWPMAAFASEERPAPDQDA